MYSGIAVRIRRNYVAPERQAVFLRHLQSARLNVSAACRSTGLAGTAGGYLQRKTDPAFRQCWEEVEAEVLDSLEEHQFKAAQNNAINRRFVLSRRRSERWSNTQTVNVGSSTRKMSDEQLKAIIENSTN
jgi:hypothetical protein